jgi:predicted dehydrogenase
MKGDAMGQKLGVGVVGARNIGKHHAKWFAQLGAEVVGIYGRSAESAEQSAAALRDLFGFTGKAYHDWEAFVRDPEIEAVSVCSPADAHAANTVDLLKAGKHVLCEKPLVWDWEASPERMLEDGRRMLRAAADAGRVLAVNAQYPAGVPALLDLYRKHRGRAPAFDTMAVLMETKGAPRSPHGSAEVWVDLGPHPFALLEALVPGGRVEEATERLTGEGHEVIYEFRWIAPEHQPRVRFELRRIKDAAPARRFGVDGFLVDYEGRNQDGEFVAVLKHGEAEWTGEDFMRASLRRFMDAARSEDVAQALFSGEAALRHLEEQVRVWDRYWRGRAGTG